MVITVRGRQKWIRTSFRGWRFMKSGEEELSWLNTTYLRRVVRLDIFARVFRNAKMTGSYRASCERDGGLTSGVGLAPGVRLAEGRTRNFKCGCRGSQHVSQTSKQPYDLIQSIESCMFAKSSLYIRPSCRAISLSIASSSLSQILPSPSSSRD
jgi:hypothetical protein